MKTFNVYKHPTRGVEAVKVGFSWPAFFFGVIWMLFKKLWTFAGIWLGIYVVLAFIEAAAENAEAGGSQAMVYLILVAVYFALWLIPAFKGNKWREENLSNRGYVLVNTVQAETPDAAIALVARQA
ncbi:MAG: DUF2628 domain-containing protein [Nitrospirae bacterium]|nr:DUF2628 domain-containing protein [Nitrospirota bacterium]